MTWKGEWGPASVIGAAGIVITVGSLLVGLGVMRADVLDAKSIVSELKVANVDHMSRLVRLETKMDILLTSAPGKQKIE